jgi:formylglycine-generating enzyme required for sulfatase activity
MPQFVSSERYDREGRVEAVSPLAFDAGTEGGRCYLVPDGVPTVEVFYHELGATRSYLASHVSPVIEIAPCRREGDRLYHSRIYINAPRQGPGSDLVYRAYNRLARHIRRWSRVEKGLYAGPVTVDRLAHGEIRLMVIANRQLAVAIDATAKRKKRSRRIEWIEVPAGSFVQGLTREQKVTMAQQLYEDFGIGELDMEIQQWARSMMQGPLSYASDKTWREIGKKEVLKGGSPALRYRDAIWALARIPEARTRFLPTFYTARFPITHAHADAFYDSAVAKSMGWDKKRRPVGPDEGTDRPEMFMLWAQAQAVAYWLGGRLPTPMEWEKAARGVDGRLYPWGDTWNPGAGHFRTSESHTGGNPDRRRGRLTAVDAYPEGASPYGCMDIVGNLGEWHTLNEKNDVGYMGYAVKGMSRRAPWFWALPMHRHAATRRQGIWYVGCRPVLEEWGRRLWPGCRPEFDGS